VVCYRLPTPAYVTRGRGEDRFKKDSDHDHREGFDSPRLFLCSFRGGCRPEFDSRRGAHGRSNAVNVVA